MTGRTGKLRLTPDDHSETSQAGWSRQNVRRPRLLRSSSPDVCRIWTRGLPTHNRCVAIEGADMAKRTRGSTPVDSRPRSSGVKITPPTHAGPVTTTHTVA